MDLKESIEWGNLKFLKRVVCFITKFSVNPNSHERSILTSHLDDSYIETHLKFWNKYLPHYFIWNTPQERWLNYHYSVSYYYFTDTTVYLFPALTWPQVILIINVLRRMTDLLMLGRYLRIIVWTSMRTNSRQAMSSHHAVIASSKSHIFC